jgi:hypothetical protein
LRRKKRKEREREREYIPAYTQKGIRKGRKKEKKERKKTTGGKNREGKQLATLVAFTSPRVVLQKDQAMNTTICGS